ncbi:MAG: ABC transporter permease [Methyloligellaceae bacterium]
MSDVLSIKQNNPRKRVHVVSPPHTPAGPWQISVLVIAALVLLPVFSLIYLSFIPSENIWPHLFSTVLPGAVLETIWLMLGVGALTLVVGTSTAWLVTMYRFPGRNILDWLLLIPLAMPTYIIAFCYVEILDYSGTIQTFLREFFGWTSSRDYWFPQIRSQGGAIFVMSFVLYPYVYLNARASFMLQSICTLEVARTLGRSPLGVFWSVALPMARPALAAGVALALMECLNDIGAVRYLGVNTLTTTVYDTWLGKSNLAGAAQIACLMLVFVAILFSWERIARKGQQYHSTTGHYRNIPEEKLEGWKGWLTGLFCAMPVILGFIAPITVLVQSSFVFAEDSLSGSYWKAAQNSLTLSSITAVVAVIIALTLAYSRRVAPTAFVKPAYRITGFGYAIPGTVLAIGVFMPLAAFDNGVDGVMREQFGVSTGLLLSGTMFALILAYTIRFLAVSNGAIESGLKRISVNLDSASRALGETAFGTLWRVHLPLLRPALGAAVLLVFVDTMKELPATLLMKPFNFDTLATHVYNYASAEEYGEAALPALTIVIFGLAPVILLSKTIATGRAGQRSSSS